MRLIIDIDGTLCTQQEDYSLAKPIKKHIEKINKLYKLGHRIIIWTARGTTTGKDWKKLTENQLVEWGVEYHELIFGKPHYDLFVCDKARESKEFFK